MPNIEQASNIEQGNTNIKVGMDGKLYHAAICGSFQEVCQITNWVEQETPTRNNILHVHVGRPLHHGTRKGMVNMEFIRHVLNFDVKLLWKVNKKGDTPLHLAARFGHFDAVKEFLDVCGLHDSQSEALRLLRSMNKKKDTALHDAARAGYADVVKLLVNGDPGQRNEPNEEGETPLYLAAERGCTASVINIMEACTNSGAFDYSFKGPCGRTALHAAVLWGGPAMVRKILEKDSRLTRIQDDEGLSPLHCAAAEIGKSRILKELLAYDNNNQNESSSLYVQDNNGRTALHIAVQQCNWCAFEDIIASCPDCIEITDNKGQNVMHYIAKRPCWRRFKEILERGHFNSLVNEKDVDGNTPLHILAASTLTDPCHICITSLPNFISKNNCMDTRAFNRKNLTFLDILAVRKQPFILEIIERKAPRGKRIYKGFKDVDVGVEEAMSNANNIGQAIVENVKKTSETRLVVTALIATISFTAALTLPGGFNQNSGKDMGMAVLARKGAFIVFLVSDIIAFTCSTLAILLHFLITTSQTQWYSVRQIENAELLTILSLGAMGLALTSGVCAVVSYSPALITTACVIPVVFFIFYIFGFLACFGSLLIQIYGCSFSSFTQEAGNRADTRLGRFLRTVQIRLLKGPYVVQDWTKHYQ